jgi:ATP-dependent DNA ligase
MDGHMKKCSPRLCELGLEGIVSKRLTAPYKSGPFKAWVKVKNPRAPAYMRMIDV